MRTPFITGGPCRLQKAVDAGTPVEIRGRGVELAGAWIHTGSVKDSGKRWGQERVIANGFLPDDKWGEAMIEKNASARIILTTTANLDEAHHLGRTLVEERLAACATLVP